MVVSIHATAKCPHCSVMHAYSATVHVSVLRVCANVGSVIRDGRMDVHVCVYVCGHF